MSIQILPTAKSQLVGYFKTRVSATEAGDVAFLTTVGMFRPGVTNMGISVAASMLPSGGSVDLYYTLDEVDIACNPMPEAQASVRWNRVQLLDEANPDVICTATAASALKLVFSHANSVCEIACY